METRQESFVLPSLVCHEVLLIRGPSGGVLTFQILGRSEFLERQGASVLGRKDVRHPATPLEGHWSQVSGPRTLPEEREGV